ncbi:MAG: InlB B-repeat-containing protein, partial [Paludibacteraceae bacterium]|nr:InlB B-repeat-containing protein [Paludibacteraceae bacterium]
TFTGWSDAQGGTNTTRQMAITDKIELVANFTVADPDWTITWKSEDGENTLATVGQKTNTATIFTGATPTKAGNDQYSYVFDGWTTAPNNGGSFYKNNMTPKATGNATYYAHFDSVVNQYTVYWKNEAGTANIEMDIDQPYGAEVAYNSATPTKAGNAQYSYLFDGWSTSVGGDVVSLPATVTGEAIYYAHFAATPKTYTITWKRDDGTLIESSEEEYGATLSPADPTKPETAEYTYEFREWTPAIANVTGVAVYTALFDAIPKTSDLEIGINESENLANEVVERANLIITSNGIDASGQLLGAGNLTITGEAIFRLEQDFAAATWYAVAVPWTVDPTTGIYNAAGNHLATGAVYVIEFDASIYASANRESGRTDYWKFLDVTGNDMQPGKLYMVYLAAGTTALEFHKKEGASLWTTSTSVAPASGSVANQENWNAIANPALYHANMETGAADGDVLKYNGNDSYVVASSDNMVVGQPIFAQVSTPSTVEATPVVGGAGMPAYRRAPQTATEANNRFVVELTHNGKLADRLIVQTAEEKANEYVIGKDLSKMSVSTKVAQMWMERYNTKLCKNTVEMNGEAVNYPLAISAPVAGEYIISNANVNANAGYALYLTQNGVVIANLSEGDYTLYLNGGITHEYGLRIGARAPQTATGMDEAVVNAQGDIKKVLIDNKVFIIRGSHVYSVDGQLVK